MGASIETVSKPAADNAMGLFERYLTLWVGLCIVAGISLGHFLPAPFQFLGRLEVAQLNLPVATAIVLFGFESGAPLATVVGVLIEVPVMLSVVRIVHRSRTWYAGASEVTQP